MAETSKQGTTKPEEKALVMHPDQYNVLMPTQVVGRIAEWHNVRITVVPVNTDPDAGDVYKVGAKVEGKGREKRFIDLFSPGKPLLMRVANAAGIIWVPAQHRLAERERDPKTGKTILVRWQTLGMLRLPDGSWQPVPGSKEIDLVEIEEEQRGKLEERVLAGIWGDEAKKWAGVGTVEKVDGYDRLFIHLEHREDYIKANLLPFMQQWRKSVVQRAESGAMLRVIRAAQGMKMQYTKEEISRGFEVARVEWAPDMKDPDVRRMVLAHGMNATTGLFTQLPAMAGQAPNPHTGHVDGPAPGEVVREPLEMSTDEEPEFDEEAARRELSSEPEIIEPERGSPADKEGGELPWEDAQQQGPACFNCGKPITAHDHVKQGSTTHYRAQDIAEQTARQFGQPHCWDCASAKRQTAGQPTPRGGNQ